MTEPDEKPIADVLAQQQELEDDNFAEPELPAEADPADVLDQRLAVPDPEEDRDYG